VTEPILVAVPVTPATESIFVAIPMTPAAQPIIVPVAPAAKPFLIPITPVNHRFFGAKANDGYTGRVVAKFSLLRLIKAVVERFLSARHARQCCAQIAQRLSALADSLNRISRFCRLLSNFSHTAASVDHILKRGFISIPVFLLIGSQMKTFLEPLQSAGRSTFARNILPVDSTLLIVLLRRNGWPARWWRYLLGERRAGDQNGG